MLALPAANLVAREQKGRVFYEAKFRLPDGHQSVA